MTAARTQIQLTLEDGPSLRSYPSEVLSQSYQRARQQAAKQTNLPFSQFPEACPYELEFGFDGWLPE